MQEKFQHPIAELVELRRKARFGHATEADKERLFYLEKIDDHLNPPPSPIPHIPSLEKAWNEFKVTKSFKNACFWATCFDRGDNCGDDWIDGSMLAVFKRGWDARGITMEMGLTISIAEDCEPNNDPLTPIPLPPILKIAWGEYKVTKAYRNARHWASFEQSVEGAMLDAFEHGWEARVDPGVAAQLRHLESNFAQGKFGVAEQ